MSAYLPDVISIDTDTRRQLTLREFLVIAFRDRRKILTGFFLTLTLAVPVRTRRSLGLLVVDLFLVGEAEIHHGLLQRVTHRVLRFERFGRVLCQVNPGQAGVR